MSCDLKEWARQFQLPPGGSWGDQPVDLWNASRELHLAPLFEAMGLDVGVEVGVEAGKYSEVLLLANPRLHLTGVDAWVTYNGYRDYVKPETIAAFYEQAHARLAPYADRCTLVQAYSMDAVRACPPESIDFVYIDGNHTFDYVMSDIIEWAWRVRPGGIVAGHDYSLRRPSRKYAVIEATHAYTKAHGITEWYLVGGQRNEMRSWFWVKP